MDQALSSDVPGSCEMKHDGNNAWMHFPKALESPLLGVFVQQFSKSFADPTAFRYQSARSTPDFPS